MSGSEGGGAEASEHVHEGAEERGWQEVTAGGEELAQTDLTVGRSGSTTINFQTTNIRIATTTK